MSEGLFNGRDKPDYQTAWELYDKGRQFNEQIDLYECVKTNENFFIGKQWEGVRSNGLPTPVINILKRDVSFVVASITSDNLKIQATPLAATPNTEGLREPARILNEELESIFARDHIPNLCRELCRDAAVRGDGCLYVWWDETAETGQEAKGTIRTETIENTRVFFGNPNDRRVQSQPWIIIETHDLARAARREARENGSADWEAIVPDSDPEGAMDSNKRTDDKVTKLLLMWKDERTGEVWAYKCTRHGEVKKPWSLGVRLYPLVWLNWDYVQDCYHGQAMLTGLIPNQIFINKLMAMSQLALMQTAFPKVVYDKTRIPQWSNQVSEAIGVNGTNNSDVSSLVKVIEGGGVSPQIAQFIEMTIEQTNASLGATNVALGNSRPDNTSAIIALQRAAATPSELTKQNLHRCLEELARIYMEFLGEYYGSRVVDTAPTPEVAEVFAFLGQEAPKEVQVVFDFAIFHDLPMSMKLEAGASSYYSEIASLQTLDNLLQAGAITPAQYLERLPDGYVPDRQGLVAELRQMEGMTPGGGGGGGQVAVPTELPPIPEHGGFSQLHRKVMDGGRVV